MKNLFTKMILLFFVSMLTVGALGATPDKDYLCITAGEAGAKVQLKKNGTPAAVSLEYTTNGSAWTDFVIGTTEGCGVTLANVGDKVYLRNKKEAKDVATFSESNTAYYCFTFSDSVSVSGNVMSLVDKNVETTTIPCDYCFCRLFYNSTSLTSAADLKLPATMLTTGCYQQMFNGCKSLKTAGVLPATTLAESCYNQMFNSCTALETAPALPADTLAEKCYYSMFQGCTALETAPALPAETLATNCYNGMFSGCTALETAPALPAETLAESCYYGMYQNCKALKTAPALPATTLAKQCYNVMFSGCSALETAPALPADTLAERCYYGMFNGCAALKTAPELPADTLAESCYFNMFYGCSALETAPALPATTLAKQCYYGMFNGCTKLKSVKVGFTKWGDLSDSGATDYRATYNWLKDAGTEATTPTFECPAELDMTIRDEHHVPANWNMPTGIEEIKSQSTVNGQQSTDLYNLQGQKVSVNGFRGIVIKNGKRYLKR
ncbi:MAG: leucine-rich repeat protein [Bacteroidaceae bacterium]|nr:leucine-rich repeat protein [Bacteroidaceae bacterium]